MYTQFFYKGQAIRDTSLIFRKIKGHALFFTKKLRDTYICIYIYIHLGTPIYAPAKITDDESISKRQTIALPMINLMAFR